MITKEEVLSALVAAGALTEYVTVKDLLEHPFLSNTNHKALGVRLLRYSRQRLVRKKRLGREHEYRLTRKGFKRLIYFYDKRKTEREIQEFKRMLKQRYNELIMLKILETKREREKRELRDLIELIKMFRQDIDKH